MLGPMAARRSRGLVAKCICILPMVLAAMRASVPRQPAWMAAMARFLASTRRMGTPAAVWRRRRFSWTFSRVSQSVKPRLRTFSFSSGETPPGAVLKAWISQGSLERAGTWRSFRRLEVRVVQLVAGADGMRDLRAVRFGDVLV